MRQLGDLQPGELFIRDGEKWMVTHDYDVDDGHTRCVNTSGNAKKFLNSIMIAGAEPELSHFGQMSKETVFVVEATSCEQQMLWEKFSNESIDKTETNKHKWVQINPGYMETIGEFHSFPVSICVSWAKIDGFVVMFYAPISKVVDHGMIAKWRKKNYNLKWDHDTREAHCDAMNFHLALNHIKTLNCTKKDNHG